MIDIGFFENKRILVTGHTGFKGAWLCKVLQMFGAIVVGYSLENPTKPALYDLCNVGKNMISITGDIRDLGKLKSIFEQEKPEIVIHMAAQPIVREAYRNPVYTYDVNVMGTVNVLECIRHTESVKSFLNVTTDKVYKNKEWYWGYRENEELNGQDPYSNSKSCSELITESYKQSFFRERRVAISTARAGNVIGGGDFATDRIIPDCMRAVQEKRNIVVRNPYSVRPYQHVLEALNAYLLIAKAQYEDMRYAGQYNIGPDEDGCWQTGDLVNEFCNQWNKITGENIGWISQDSKDNFHEATYLKLDTSKIKATLHWNSNWSFEDTMQKIVEWYSCYLQGGNMDICSEKQIQEFFKLDR